MVKTSKIIFISIIALILVGMPLLAVLSLTEVEALSNEEFIKVIEKRFPTHISDIAEAENKILEFEYFFNDLMPFRKFFITTYSNALHFINVPLFPDNVTYGKNGYMYLAWSEDYHRGLINSNMDHIADAVNNVKTLEDYLSSRNIDFAFVLMPDKASIYPEYLPDWYTETGIKSPNEFIMDYALSNEGFDCFVNLNQMYTEKKNTYGDYLYHKTDTHYSYLGAYYSYIETMENINSDDLNIAEILLLKDYSIIPQANGYDLKGMAALEKEVDDFKVILTYENATIDTSYVKYQVEGSEYEEYYNENALNSETVLYIGDSFMGYQKPFYINTYTKSYFLHMDKQVGSMRDFDIIVETIDKTNPDVVVFETVERSAYNRLYKMYDTNDTIAEHLYQGAQSFMLYDKTTYSQLGLRNIELINYTNFEV